MEADVYRKTKGLLERDAARIALGLAYPFYPFF